MTIEKKSVVVPIRLTPTQSRRFRAKAEGEGLRLAEWLRGLAQKELARHMEDTA